MKLVSYIAENGENTGLFYNEKVFPLAENAKVLSLPSLPQSMLAFLQGGEAFMAIARKIEKAAKEGQSALIIDKLNTNDFMAPVPHPTSCRDGYAFRQHVASARRNRKVDMIPEFDQYPIFYFTNHNAIQGQGDILCMPDHFHKLDFELEASIVIGKKGRNITAADADIGKGPWRPCGHEPAIAQKRTSQCQLLRLHRSSVTVRHLLALQRCLQHRSATWRNSTVLGIVELEIG